MWTKYGEDWSYCYQAEEASILAENGEHANGAEQKQENGDAQQYECRQHRLQIGHYVTIAFVAHEYVNADVTEAHSGSLEVI